MMDTYDKYILNKYNKSTGVKQNKYFCVFRVGKKFKDIGKIAQFSKHMNREISVLNAGPSKYNKVLIGPDNTEELQAKVAAYIKDVKIRKNANIAFDVLLTASHGFYDNLDQNSKEKWINKNIEFLQNRFNNNCIYAVLHYDETTPHIHALIVPRFWDEVKQCYKLQSNKYIDGVEKLRSLQDDYAEYMTNNFNNLMRGIKGSKAKHIDIKTYYTLINQDVNIKDKKSIIANAKENNLNKVRIKALEKTLDSIYRNGDMKLLFNDIEKVQKDKKIYIKLLDILSKKYNIDKKDMKKIIENINNKQIELKKNNK